ncbi:unnamed protein product [Durusdinium trenchii]|uniref:Uncharacterized protein n=1 Tax=Durusdinium trenchii TaxID=1381693 RepID=A0ABP0HZV1_9DINO
MELIVALPLIYLIRTSTPEFWSPFRWASLNRGSQPCFSDVSSRGTGRAARMAHGAPPGAALGAGEAPKSAETWARQWGRFGMSKAGGMDGTKVLARFWARRYGRGRGFTPGPPGGHVWRHGLFWLLWSFTSVAATPTVVYVRVQAASGETTVAANETVEDVRLDSEVRLIFDEDIILHSDGKATLWDGTSYSSYSQGAGLVIPAADPSHLVLNEGNADANFLTEFVAYYLRLDPNTVRSASDGSASVTFEYSFSTGDFTAPILSSVSPSYSEPSALPGVAPILTFSESISAAADTAKVISIQNLYTGLSSVLTCRSNSVVIEDSRVSINSGGFITYCQRYEVTYSAGCFLDVSPSENAVAALSSGTYTFETSCITSLNPPSDVETLALDGSLQLTFSEAVQRGTGSIILLPLSFADEYRAIPIHDTTQVSFDTAMTTMTIIPNDPLLASSVAQSNWCRINAMSLNDCKGQTWDITIGSSVLQRVTPTTLLAQVDLLQPLQAAGSAGQTYRVRTKAADVTPPVITMVSTHGTSESSIRVTLRLDESGTSYCQAFPDGAGGQKLGVTLAEIGTSFSSSAVFSSSWGYAEMDIDVTDLVAKTYYNVFCYAKDLEAPAPNVVTVGAALATRQRVRSMDTTAPSSSNCSAQAVAGREDAIEVTLTLDEPGTAYCALVRSGLVAPSHYVVTAAGFKANTSFYPPYDASMVVDMSSGSTGLAPLTRGTDYDIFCRRISFHTVIFPGNGQGVPLQCGPPGAVGVVRTLDLTPPQMSITDVEVQPDSLSSDFEALIKAQSSNCTDSFGNECGSFWVYDLDDLEDSAADGVSTQADFDHSKWKYQEDVSILLLNLEEATEYPYIYCYAEDDEDDGVGSNPNKMTFNSSAPASQILVVQESIGSVKTLDQTPPSFTLLEIQDPTAWNDRIEVTFALNEPGTAYCCATRSDSGETALEMHVNRIIAANWAAVYSNSTQTITMTKLDNVDPSLTNRHDEDVFFEEGTLYDIYCWARDSAIDTKGYSRPNSMTQEYVGTDVLSASAPSGGRTGHVWVTDSTPPQMILVDAESLDTSIQVGGDLRLATNGSERFGDERSSASKELCGDHRRTDTVTRSHRPCQFDLTAKMLALTGKMREELWEEPGAKDEWLVTLQLNEPGTVWCQLMSLQGPNSSICDTSTLQDNDTAASCYYESYIKGSAPSAFRAEVPQAYRNVHLTLDRLLDSSLTSSGTLVSETSYQVLCYAEDDWDLQASGLSVLERSPQFVAPGVPNQVSLNAVHVLRDAIGSKTTLDITAPSFTYLAIDDPGDGASILVSFTLNEPGTVYCRATRSDSGEGAADMQVIRIMGAGWANTQNGSEVPSNITMTKLENLDPALTNRDDLDIFFDQAHQYDVYCLAKDDATNDGGTPRPNLMTTNYIWSDVVQPTSPQGGRTAGVWIADTTPPTMMFVRGESIGQEVIQLTLQLDEPGTIWCQAADVVASVTTENCAEDEVQDLSPDSPCFFEDFVKGQNDTQFRMEVHEAFRDVSIDINRIPTRNATSSTPLQHETAYTFFCFAEDDWPTQVAAASNSVNLQAPTSPNKVDLAAARILQLAIGNLTTLDEAPPSFTSLTAVDPTATNDRIVVTFTLNEAGTAYCRPTRRDAGATPLEMTVDRILSAGWAATYDGDEATLEMTATVQGGSEAVVEAQQYDIYCWAEDRAVDSRGYARPNYMTHSYATTGVGNGSVPSGGKIEAVWVTDSTPPSMLFVAAEGVKTEDTLQVVLQLNEPGTVWCQVAEPLTAASSVYCREDDISSDPSAQCYWETFMKGSVALGTSFSAEVPLPFTYVRVEMNRIWQKGLTQGDPLLPETEYKIFCLAEDDWPSQAQASDLTSVYFNASSLSPQRSTLPQVVAFKDAAGTRSTLDLSPPNLTVTSVGTTEQQITVLATLSEPGTAWCRAVRRGFAIPTLLEILAADFSVPLLVAPYNGTVTMTSESGVGAAWSVPLVRGTDYEVYCYAEDDSCVGCQQPSGIDTAAIAATLTSVRTMDTTPPQLTAVDLRSIARDTIQVTLQADEGSRVWCAAWSTLSESDLNASNYEANIKNWEGTCKDSWGRDCGSFWVYDMDDLEDTTLDGMSSEDDYRHYQTWRHHEDVTIVLSGLLESTEYGYIYCFAEDDEPDGAGSVPNKMSFDVGVDASQVSKLQEALGNVTTLDETPPSFTELLIQDPTAWNDRIEVTFALNEPGTAYCRATRSDSGEVEEDMYIGWIQTAQWSSAHDGSAAPSSIVITALENSDDSARLNAPIQEAHQYDVYCWALDNAVDTAGFPRANLMQQSYVVTESNSTSSPLGGKTKGVWVVDTTPPTMILVHAEAISAVELQVILQLDEPGTVWCQPSDMAGIATQCQSTDIQNESASADCYWLNFIQGNNFRAEVHEAFVDYSINMNLLYPIGSNASEALTSESQYEVFCYAEDDWSDQANGAPLSSVNFVTQSLRNAVSFADANVVRTSIGVQRTLDTSPPSFTMLAIEDPTVANDRIVVTFTLNEPGTAYCRPTRSDSGQTAADMTLHRILSAGWFAGHDGGTSASSITISKLENAVEAVPIYEASQYDIYCAAKDTAVDSKGFAIPNWMSFSYIANAIGSPSTPSGGFTSNVWVVDSTPPELILVDVFAPSESSLQIRLQLNEPGTVWCAPVEVENSTFCTFEDISNVSGSPCDYESFIQGDAMLQAVFYAEVSEAHKDVDIKMDRIMTRDGQQSYPLEHQHQYWIFCFAEDDWPLQAAAGMNSSNFVAPAEANRISLRTAQDFANLTGLITTLDQSPPSFSFLHIEDPTVANDRLHVIFALNEPGTAYCRAVRLDSGETPADMSITRILTAQWMASNDGMSNSSIEITQLENVDPRLTGRDDQVVPIVEATQYDVYCWAQDTAVDSYGYPKSNYMDIEYVRTDVQSSTEPQGGRSPGRRSSSGRSTKRVEVPEGLISGSRAGRRKDDTFDLLIQEEGAALNQLFSGKPDLSVEEHLQFFVSALKTVCMRTSVEYLPYLMTEDRDLPVFRRAMTYTAYDEALVRTQARSAQLWFYPKLKQNQELLCIALDIARSELPTPLCTLLRKNWGTMAQAASKRNDALFRVGAECEEDVWEFLGELLSLELPEMAELISGIVVGSVVGGLSNLTSRNASGANHWSMHFPNGETDARPMMIIPSPSAFSPSPKSYTTSTASFSQDQPCQIATFTASGLAGATKADIFAAPQISSDLSMALTLRTLAIYARTLRRLGIGCALMPVVELLLLPSTPSTVICAMEQLGGGCVTEEGAAFAEEFAARAMEDLALKPRIDEELSEEEKEVLLEQAKKRRDEYWQKELRTAAMTGCNMVPNPFREAFLAMLDVTAGVSDSLTFGASCNINSVQSADGKTAATFLMSELKLAYPGLLEDTKLLVHEVPVMIVEEPEVVPPGPISTIAEGVWVVDTTPPSMTLVRAEGISGDTLQVTLQLDEPGTVWCAAVQMGSDPIYCLPGTVASGGSFSASAGLCEYETLIKAFSSVQVEVSRILRKDLSAADALTSETAYHVYCFAEDDWPSDAQGAARQYILFAHHFGRVATQLHDPTALNTQIEVVFALNEAGTAYCRPLRSDSAEAAKAMDLNVIISAGWSARHDPLTSENSSIIMTGTRPLHAQELDEAKQYDVYCWAQDEAKTNFGYPRPQYMTQAYVGLHLSRRGPTRPDGDRGGRRGRRLRLGRGSRERSERREDQQGRIGSNLCSKGSGRRNAKLEPKMPGKFRKGSKVWVVDSTAPRMLFAAWDAIRDEETLQVTLQLDEPGTVWCQAALNVSTSGFCAETELQDSDPQADCYYESYIKGNSTAVFRKEVPEAFRDVEVEVNRLPSRDGSFAPVPLEPKTGYKIVCFAEDDWVEEAQSGSINFVAPLVANKAFMNDSAWHKTMQVEYCDLSMVIWSTEILARRCGYRKLIVPFRLKDVIMVSVSLDEAGTVWCRALRKNSRSAYEAPEIVATGFLVEVQSGSVDQVNITAENVKGDALARGTDYEVYCFARDVLCLGCDAPSGSSTQAIQASRTFVRTADATPPRIYVMYAESISHDTIQLTLQMDEGSKLWCGVESSDPTGMSTDFESLIKEANCSESRAARPCGSFWIYDLDDVEDTALDGVSSLSDYADAYRIGHDVQLSITGLKEKTDYAYIYCFAEDDETDGSLGSSPNKMSFDATSAATTDARSLVASVSTAIGAVQTLDETPPSFTELSVVDPTASEGVIVVSFALNEPGTAYCRATRSDSGETGSEMHPNRIIAAGWSAAQGGPGFPTANISLTQLRSDVPYDVQPVEIYSSTQYDVYCWAKDDATTTAGFDRRNYMSQSYVSTAVGDPMLPLGGATLGVWVDDSTPPTMRFISAEAISRDTIQVTLQLDEPGTIWCAAAELDSSSELQNCRESEVQDTEPNDAITPCYYETFIKGSSSENVVFSHEVHDAFRDVDIEVNRIWQRDRNGSSTLLPETSYRIFCFAEDNWVLKTTASVVSPNFVAPSLPNKSPFSQVQELTAAIGTRTTLDEDPPSFTSLTIPNPTASNDRILVIFALNEPGTAYCRARRVDVEPGESMHIPDILAAGWRHDVFWFVFNNWGDRDAAARIEAFKLCQDVEANFGLPNNSQPCCRSDEDFEQLFAGRKDFRTGDQSSDAVRLQLDEPGTVWCAATEVLSGTVNCQDSELQENNPLAACYFQDYIKGNLSSSFQVEVHEAFQDVDVEVNRILQKDMAGDAPLELQTTYQVFCYAEDDWKIQADSASNSADYVSPAGPQGSSLQSVQSFAQSMGQLSTLDEAPPSFTVLEIQDPTAAEGILVISFALNEVGTAYCRVTRSDSGETAADMQINRVLTANWNAVYDGSSNATITMNNLENVNPLLTNREDEVAPLVPGQQYDVYCWGKDSANTTFGYSRPNYMTSAYVSTAVTSPTAPLGGYTKGVWIADTTPPSMLLTSLDALSDTQILVTLQLDEPGTVWCAATVPDSGSSSYCRPSDLQDTDNTAQCYYEDYIKGSVAQGTRFETQVPQAYVDVYVEVNRIALATGTGSPLPAETQFVMLCFAQDNWDLRTQAAYANGDGSPNFVAPLPNKVTLAEVNSFIAATVASGQSALTLDLTAPTATARSLYAPTSSESSLEVLFSVDEASTLYCLAVFSGEATPHVSTVAIEGQSQNCPGYSVIGGVGTGSDRSSSRRHASDSVSLRVPNRNVLPLLTAQVNDLTPPQLSVVRASAAEPNQITVQGGPGGELVFTHGAASKTLVGDMDVNKNFEETAYETYCGAEDRATNPDCTGCTVPNVNTLTEMGAVRDSIGQIITRDVDAPIFDVLGVRGVSDSMLTVTLQLNEPGTAYCVALSRGQAWRCEKGSSTSSIDINKLRNHVDEPLLTEGTAYDVYCWAKVGAHGGRNEHAGDIRMLDGGSELWELIQMSLSRLQGFFARVDAGTSMHFDDRSLYFTDRAIYDVQSYVETRFAELVHAPDLASVANGGLVDMVRTWDITPPVLAVIEVESRSEDGDSITVTLQLDEPGTAYCSLGQ